MKKVDRAIGLILMVLSIIVIYSTRTFPAAGENDVGASFFPKWSACILILLSLLLIFNSSRVKVKDAPVVHISKKAMLGVALCIGYLLFIYFFGFYVSSLLFLISFMWIYNFRKWLPLCLVSLAITASIYLIFEVSLQVPLPSGSLFS